VSNAAEEADWPARIWSLLRDQIYSRPDGSADWSSVDQYLIRHAARHAAAASRLGDLLADDDYLAHADAERLQLELAAERRGTLARSPQRVVYQASYPAHLDVAPAWRRHVLALDAARLGATDLSRELSGRSGWTVRWSTGSGRSAAIRQCLLGHEHHVTAVVTLPLNGRPHAVTGDADGRLLVWDLHTGAAIRELAWGDHRPAEVKSMATAERATSGAGTDAPLVVVGDAAGGVWAWNAGSGLPVVRFTASHAAVSALATVVLPEGGLRILTGDAGGSLALWDPADGTACGAVSTQHSGIGALAVLPAGSARGGPLAVTGAADGRIRLWDVASREQVGELGGLAHGAVTALAVTRAKGRSVCVTGYEDGELVAWDLAGDRVESVLPVHHFGVTAVVEQRGRLQVLTAGGDGRVALWDLDSASRRPLLDLPSPVEGWTCVAVCEIDGRAHAVSGGFDRIVRVWDLGFDSWQVNPAAGHRRPVRAVGVAAVDGSESVVSVGADGELQVRSPLSESRGRALGAVDQTACAGFPPGVADPVTVGAGGTVGLGPLDARRTAPPPPAMPSAVACVVLDDDEWPLVAVGDAVLVLDGGLWRELVREQAPVVALGVTTEPAAEYALATAEGAVVVRDVADPDSETRLPMVVPGVRSLALRRDVGGIALLVGTEDELQLWRAGEGDPRLRVLCPDPVTAVAWAGATAVLVAQGPDVMLLDVAGDVAGDAGSGVRG
jgi:WD40 repeat protein